MVLRTAQKICTLDPKYQKHFSDNFLGKIEGSADRVYRQMAKCGINASAENRALLGGDFDQYVPEKKQTVLTDDARKMDRHATYKHPNPEAVATLI